MTGAEQSKAERLRELEALILEIYALRDQKPLEIKKEET